MIIAMIPCCHVKQSTAMDRALRKRLRMNISRPLPFARMRLDFIAAKESVIPKSGTIRKNSEVGSHVFVSSTTINAGADAIKKNMMGEIKKRNIGTPFRQD